MAGNVGTQSLAVTIRVLMDEKLTARQKFDLVLKEMRVGFFSGLMLGALALVFIGLYVWLFKGKTLPYALCISGCAGAALVLSMVLSSLVGTVVPMFFKKVHIDPAVASPADYHRQRFGGRHRILRAGLSLLLSDFPSGVIRSVSFSPKH